MIRLLMVVFFVEVGLVLTVAPWARHFWERNYFVTALPGLQTLLTNYFFRGAVSGLGLINLAAALAELRSLLARRRESGTIVSLHDSPVEE